MSGTKAVPLGHGKVALIDDVDAELVAQYTWHLSSTGYAVWRGIKDGRKQTIRMHRLVTNCPAGKVVDHINHNPLDNRRSNLCVTNQSGNMRNLTVQGRGYYWHSQNNNWVVDIHGKHIGCFSTEDQAKQVARFVRSGGTYVKPERTTCKYGHSLADAYIVSGARHCRPCQRQRSQQYHKNKRMRIREYANT